MKEQGKRTPQDGEGKGERRLHGGFKKKSVLRGGLSSRHEPWERQGVANYPFINPGAHGGVAVCTTRS